MIPAVLLFTGRSIKRCVDDLPTSHRVRACRRGRHTAGGRERRPCPSSVRHIAELPGRRTAMSSNSHIASALRPPPPRRRDDELLDILFHLQSCRQIQTNSREPSLAAHADECEYCCWRRCGPLLHVLRGVVSASSSTTH